MRGYNTLSWSLALASFVFVFGACVGSFLNVCIYRIPRDLAIDRPRRSFCPHCQHTLAWYDNIPLISIWILHGRCRHCGVRISRRYFVVEIVVALLFTLVWLQYERPAGQAPLGLLSLPDARMVPVYWLVMSGLTLATFVDCEFLIIPNRVTLGGIALGVPLSAFVPSLHGVDSWKAGGLAATLGAAVGVGLLWLVAEFGRWIFRREAMGLGDVKLLGAVGAFFGWRAVLFVIMLSSLLGSIAGILLILLGRKQLRSRIPYGPYLALATVIWMFWGQTIWSCYRMIVFPPIPAS